MESSPFSRGEKGREFPVVEGGEERWGRKGEERDGGGGSDRQFIAAEFSGTRK